MFKKVFFSIIITTQCFFFWSQSDEICNGSFEDSLTSWSVISNGAASVNTTISSAAAYSGNLGLIFEANDINPPASTCGLTSCLLNLEQGSFYRVSFWAKSDTQHPLVVVLQATSAPFVNYAEGTFTTYNTWTQYEFYTADSNAVAGLKLKVKPEASGVYYFDDFLMESIPALPTYAEVCNQDFEFGLSGWIQPANGGGINASVENNEVQNGVSSVKVITSSTSSGQPIFSSCKSDISENTTYQVSFWMKCDFGASVDPQPHIVEVSSSLAEPPYTTYGFMSMTPSDSWTEYSFITQSDTTVYSNVRFAKFKFFNDGVYYIDNINIEEVTLSCDSEGVDVVSACDSYTWSNGITYDANNYNSATTIAAQTPGLFDVGPNTTWTNAYTSCVLLDGNNGAEQTFVINVTNLPPGGANYRVAKTVANGNWFNGNAQPLVLGLNTITVASVIFDRIVKFQFSSGAVEFDNLLSNGNLLYSSIPTQTFINAAGCDSVVTLDLTLSNSSTGIDVVQACDSYTWINGITYDASNYNSATTIDAQTPGLFDVGPNITWTNAYTACVLGDGNEGAQQTLVINVTSLPPGGANYRVAKTVANGNWFNGNAQALTLGLNTITVPAVAFDRIVKFQFSSGAVEFDEMSLNGNTVYSSIATYILTSANGCDSIVTLDLTLTNSSIGIDVIQACDSYTWIDGVTYTAGNYNVPTTIDAQTPPLFATGPNTTWTNVYTACVLGDGNNGAQQTLTINITTLPPGANYRIVKTVANGNFFNGNAIALTLGLNTISVPAVAFDRVVKFQFSDGGVEFDEMSLNGNTVYSSTPTFALSNSVGCDSTVTLDLTINNSSTATDVITACDSYTWIDGNSYTESVSPVVNTNHLIETVGMTFSPSSLNIFVGDTVTFVNTGGNHNVNGTTGTFSGNPESFGNNVGSGWTYTYVFGTAGTYDYQCDPHAPMMSGTITVSETNNITYVIPNAAGCDSIISLDFTINPVSLDLGDDTLTICSADSVLLDAGVGFDSYSWNTGATTQSIYANSSGTYSATVSQGDAVVNDYSMSFDGQDDYIQLSDVINFGTNSFSVSIDCYLNSFEGNDPEPYSYIVGTPVTGSTNDYGFKIQTATSAFNGGFEAHINDGGTTNFNVLQYNNLNQTNVQLNEWYNLTMVVNRTTNVFSFYVDGILIDSDNISPNFGDVDLGIPISIGVMSFNNTSLLNGKTDNLQIWNTALSQSEIEQYMNCPPIGDEAGLVGYWNFEEGSGTTALDLTANGNNGTINGATYDTDTPEQICNTCSATDSVVVLQLPAIEVTDTQVACDSYTWIDGATYTANNNTSVFIYTATTGCDSTVTLDLTINNSSTATDVITACDSYTWIDGNTYIASNNSATWTITETSCGPGQTPIEIIFTPDNYGGESSWILFGDAGSIANATPGTYSSAQPGVPISTFACADTGQLYDIIVQDTEGNGFSGAVGGNIQVIDCDGNILYNLRDEYPNGNFNFLATSPQFEPAECTTASPISGCDITVTLDLTINNSNTGIDVITACDAYTWIDGNTYTTSNNTATHTLTNSIGCDSVVTLDLTINNSSSSVDVVTACDTYNWIDGNAYSASNNSATFVTTNLAGCDNTILLNLTLNSANSGTDVIIACDAYTWIDGNTYTASNNSATHTLINAAGCDSIVSLDLTINNSSTATDVITACDTYTWIDGNTYTTNNNSATHTLTNSVGCDSVVTLDLTINNSSSSVDEITACDAYTWIDGNTYSASNNSATFVTTNLAGCDNTILLNLTLNSANAGTEVITACDSYTWIDGNTYTASNNSATHTLSNASGCDSIVTLDLTINNSNTGIDVIIACDAYTWIDGNTYTASNNSATHTLTNAAGCDSIVSLDLTVNNSNTGIDVVTACDTYTWIDGNTYTTSNNTATHTLTNSVGCDSVVTLDLIINNSSSSVDVVTACDAYTWIDGNTYTASNNSATHILTNTAGCDSIVTLNLTVNSSYSTIDVQGSCDSYTWIDGNTYTSSNNTASVLLTSSAGCDSLVTLDLTIDSSLSSTDTQIACESFTWIDGISYSANNNTATFLLTAIGGCDSLVTLNLTINSATTGVDEIVACDTYTWIDGNTYTENNSSATHMLTNSVGCDSLVTLDLTINNSNTGIDNITACDSHTWIDGNTYTNSNNTATHTLSNAFGCDSVVTLNLTINSSSSSIDVVSQCGAYTWIDGIEYTESNNVATFVTTNASGCDSTITLDLTILESSNSTDEHEACGAFTWIDGNTYTESNNTATFITTNVSGCDSIITLALTLTILDPDLGPDEFLCANDSIALSPQEPGFEYIWNTGETTESIYVTEEGIYYVTVTDPETACTESDTVFISEIPVSQEIDVQSACDAYTWLDGITYTESNNTATYIETSAVGCDSIVFTLNLTIGGPTCFAIPEGLSPNGDNTNDTWTIGGLNQYPDAVILVFNRWGNEVYRGDAFSDPWDGSFQGDPQPTADYYYILDLGDGQKFNGVVTLKR